jgi:hypothetical protein
MKMHSLVDPPERDLFAEFRQVLRDGRQYRGLCFWYRGSGDRIIDHLYEFCAMNGHLAAFEEVFKEEVA